MSNQTYKASSIQVLEGLEAVRKRPSMYIGDVGLRGLHHLVWEVVDNTIDEAMAGFCNEVSVTINEDNSITVEDNGRGIPVDIHPKQNKSVLEVVMTVLHAGGKFDKDSYKVSGGLHGVGISCVNALSKRLEVTVFREGKIYRQEYARGIPKYDVREIGASKKRGTTVHFEPDPETFTDLVYNYKTIKNRLRELSYLNSKVKLNLEDKRSEENIKKESFYSDDGLRDFILYLNENKNLITDDPIIVSGEKNGVPIDIAMVYNDSFQENLISYVNNINTIEGGTHVAGFRKSITKTMKSYAEKSGFLDKKIEVIGDDFREGLTAVISVKVVEPQFEGQTKTKLGNQEVSGAVETFLSDAIGNFLEENPKTAKQIIQKVILAAQARQAAKKARELVQRKTAMHSSTLPGKLSDCSSNDPNECELYLVEGDSAGGTAKSGRDRRTQAILPLRGKILNVEKSQAHKIYDNEQIINIITALGISIGNNSEENKLNLEKIRYKKIIIMTDADVDGSHIKTLILTLFFRYMKEVIEEGFLYVALPPLYLVKKGTKKEYCWTESERKDIIKKFSVGSSSESVFVQRYKGLGEMNADQLWETTMDPSSRTMKKVTIESAIEADKNFSILMGDDVLPRRKFIEGNARYANIDI